MKRLLLVLPFIFTLILSVVCPVRASASAVTYTYDETMPSFEENASESQQSLLNNGFCSADSFISNFSIDSSKSYVLYQFRSQYQTNSWRPYSYLTSSFFFSFDSLNCSYADDYIQFDCSYLSLYYYEISISFSSDFSSNGSSQHGPLFLDSYSSPRIRYYPDSHFLEFYSGTSLVYDFKGREEYIESNIYDFSDSLKVDVKFTPALSGEVDRSYISNNTKYYSEGFTMTITNNSYSAIQFQMYISPGTQEELYVPIPSYDSDSGFQSASSGSSSTYLYNGKEVRESNYIFYKDAWVYSSDMTNSNDFYNRVPRKFNKSTRFHYVASGETFTQIFKWSQLPIKDNIQYTVTVQAILTDYDCATEIHTTHLDDDVIYPEYKQLFYDEYETVYSSQFIIDYLGDVQYDSSDTSNGIIPYSNSEDFQRLAYSYKASENDDLSINYDNVNLYDDPDSILYHSGFSSSRVNTSVPSSSSLGSFLNYSQSFLNFLQSCFNFFPSWLWTVISLSIFVLVVVGVLKIFL